MTLTRTPPGRHFWLFVTGICLVGGAGSLSCSAQKASEQTTHTTPPDPAADSVADGLIESDTTIADDDTLETTIRVKAPTKP